MPGMSMVVSASLGYGSGRSLWAAIHAFSLLRDNLRLYAAPLSRTLDRDIELCYSDTSTRAVFIAPGCLLSGRSAAWLARLVRDQEAGGSNPLAPTNFSSRVITLRGKFLHYL